MKNKSFLWVINFMEFVILILSIIVSIKTISYGMFEIKENKNTFGGIFVIAIAVTNLVLPNVVVYLKGI